MNEDELLDAHLYATSRIGETPISIKSYKLQNSLADTLKLYTVKQLDYIIKLLPVKSDENVELDFKAMFGVKAEKIEVIRDEIINNAAEIFSKLTEKERIAYEYCIQCQKTFFMNPRPICETLDEETLYTAFVVLMKKGLLFHYMEFAGREYIVIPDELMEIFEGKKNQPEQG